VPLKQQRAIIQQSPTMVEYRTPTKNSINKRLEIKAPCRKPKDNIISHKKDRLF